MQPIIFEAAFFSLLGVSLGGLTASLWTSSALRKNFSDRLQVFETRVKNSESRATALKEQLNMAQADSILLKERIDRERQAKELEVAGLRLVFQKQALQFSAYALLAGVFAGGLMGWTVAGSRAEVKHLQRVIEIEVASRTAVADRDRLEGQFKNLQSENRKLRASLLGELEQKALLFAKMEVMLEGFSGGKWGRDFVFKQKQLIEDWNNRIDAKQPASASRFGALLALSK